MTIEHNHQSTVVKPYGECPRCDQRHDRIQADKIEELWERVKRCTCEHSPCKHTDYSERLSVSIEEIDAQREMGWPNFHPEKYCHRCGGMNVSSWYVDSDRFNAALGHPNDHEYNGIVCPGCFVQLHEEATGMHTTWKLIPDPGTPFRWTPKAEKENEEWDNDPDVLY